MPWLVCENLAPVSFLLIKCQSSAAGGCHRVSHFAIGCLSCHLRPLSNVSCGFARPPTTFLMEVRSLWSPPSSLPVQDPQPWQMKIPGMHGAGPLDHGAGRGKGKIHGAGQKSVQINCFVSEANIYRTKLDPSL